MLENCQNLTESEKRYLNLLSKSYPTIQDVRTAIINLQSIIELPKGTEHFMSDLHGEHEAFMHIVNNASGEIRKKVDKLYSSTLTASERAQLATLIYYPEEKLKERKNLGDSDLDEWYKITLRRLIDISRLVASKYSRSKVRRSLPEEHTFILDELINSEQFERKNYYESIISAIVKVNNADEFIIAISDLIKRLVVDRMHIVGDIYDRGHRPDLIIDMLRQKHSVDIQWGNHDVLWMGAASGCDACIATVLNNAIKYGNLDSLETAYGINLRPLALFAQENYSPSKRFELKIKEDCFRSKDLSLMSKMYHAISIILFKCEGRIIMRHPEFKMDDRLVLNKIDFSKSVVNISGKEYPIELSDFPTLDPSNPYKLTEDEENVMEQLELSFRNSYKLQRDVKFLYSVGSIYLKENNYLLFHGCFPLNPDGSFLSFNFGGVEYAGKELFDYADRTARLEYYAENDSPEAAASKDFLWFLWCGRHSPLFGRDRITTFERIFISDKTTWKERDNAYYQLIENPEVLDKIFDDFGLDKTNGHIINGHVPVHAFEGESPIKANGKVIVIDGGFCKALQKRTGIAGYTLIFDSYGLRISAHEPFCGKENAIKKNSDILSQELIFSTAKNRLTVGDTDAGHQFIEQINELKCLLQGYLNGDIKETRKAKP